MLESLYPMASVAVILFFSPGPAPLTLAATSAQTSIKQTLPLFYGILLGTLIIALASAYGLPSVLLQHDTLAQLLKLFGAAYLLFLAWKISRTPNPSSPSQQNQATVIPGFRDGLFLYLLNPKAYAGFIALFTQHLTANQQNALLLPWAITTCLIIAISSDLVWLYFGKAIAPAFKRKKSGTRIRYVFSLSLVLLVAISFFK